MINVNSIKSTGIVNGIVTYLIDFSFDNFSTLPQKIYQNGLSSYLLADGSTATNVSDNTSFVYNNGRWIKDGKSTSPKEDNSNIFTDNGNYSITNNDSTGISNITVDVEQGSPEPTLISKTITENGNYSAVDDEADGYSDVRVDVPPVPNFSQIATSICLGDSMQSLYIYNSTNGRYVIPDIQTDKDTISIICGTDVVSMSITNTSGYYQILFATDSNFNSITVNGETVDTSDIYGFDDAKLTHKGILIAIRDGVYLGGEVLESYSPFTFDLS